MIGKYLIIMPSESEIIDLMKKAKIESEEKFQKYVDFYKTKFPEFYDRLKLEFGLDENTDITGLKHDQGFNPEVDNLKAPKLKKDESFNPESVIGGDKPENPLMNQESPLGSPEKAPIIEENKDQIELNAGKSTTSSMEVNDFLEQKKKEIQNPNEKMFNELDKEVKKDNLETKIENPPKGNVTAPVEQPKKKSKIGIIIAVIGGGIVLLIASLFLFGIL